MDYTDGSSFFAFPGRHEYGSRCCSTGRFGSRGRGCCRDQLLGAGSRCRGLDQGRGRPNLRRPPSTPNAGEAARGGIQEHHHELCSPLELFGLGRSTQQASLRTTLVSLDNTYYQVEDQPRFEVTVENVDSAPLRLPFSPHLADLQPEDPAQKFAYSELQVVLWIGGKTWDANTGGAVSLYGADDHAHTMVTLNQGEWLRIIGKGKLTLPSDEPVSELIRSGSVVDHAFAKVSLYRLKPY